MPCAKIIFEDTDVTTDRWWRLVMVIGWPIYMPVVCGMAIVMALFDVE